jgi:hypothetical protein
MWHLFSSELEKGKSMNHFAPFYIESEHFTVYVLIIRIYEAIKLTLLLFFGVFQEKPINIALMLPEVL